jgi:hypothetical protein
MTTFFVHGSTTLTEVSASHPDTSHSVELLWTSDQTRRDVYRATYNARQTSMPSTGFEPATSASERMQTHTLDRARPPASATNTYG